MNLFATVQAILEEEKRETSGHSSRCWFPDLRTGELETARAGGELVLPNPRRILRATNSPTTYSPNRIFLKILQVD
uniref:Uncharacterized protein n=1 Tax=Steinernema glaseri TaxID=37863 RepID=A0A1I8ANT8_9BILA